MPRSTDLADLVEIELDLKALFQRFAHVAAYWVRPPAPA